MLALIAILAFVPFLEATRVVTPGCSSNVNITYTWLQGQDAKFTFLVPVTVSTWTVVAIFDKPVTTLNSWNGILYECANGKVCTFTNKVKLN